MHILTIDPKLTKAKVLGMEETGEANGIVEGYASIFGNEDLGGDVVQKGAFSKTLRERVPAKEVKLFDSHRMYAGTSAVIGLVTEAKEDEKGLYFKAVFSSAPDAQILRAKVAEGIIDAVSFGYEIIKADGGDYDESGRRSKRTLKELKLYEVSLVVWGMNPKARTEGVKSIAGIDRYSEIWHADTKSEFEADVPVEEAVKPVKAAPAEPTEKETTTLYSLPSFASLQAEMKADRDERVAQALRDLRNDMRSLVTS